MASTVQRREVVARAATGAETGAPAAVGADAMALLAMEVLMRLADTSDGVRSGRMA